MSKLSPPITQKIVDGVSEFFLKIKEIKSEKDAKNTFGGKWEDVGLFLGAVNTAVGNIVKHVDRIAAYKKCKTQNKPEKKEKGVLDKKLEKSLLFIQNSSICKLNVESWIAKMIKSPHLVTALTEFWTEFLKIGKLEKKWNSLNWYLVGTSAGTLVSQLIRPSCSKGFKRNFMKKWKKRFMKQ